MNQPIAIFYHGLLVAGDPPKQSPRAVEVVWEQMSQLNVSGLLRFASEFHVGINGGEESRELALRLLPAGAKITLHGLDSRSENLTVCMVHEFALKHPGWRILYFHAKAATKTKEKDIIHGDNWRRCMMHDLVLDWRKCVPLLASHDIVCSHWKWSQLDGTQHIPAGNFLWITSDFAAKLPSMHERARIKEDGIGALSSRFESEVFWGNGPKPRVFQFRPTGPGMP